MSPLKKHPEPEDAAQRRAVRPVIVYPGDIPAMPDQRLLAQLRKTARVINTVRIEPRQAGCFEVPAGHFFRIKCIEGPQVGDLNLWHAQDLSERFFSGKTRALHATHLSTGDSLWSNLPSLRPMATITDDSLEWYGWDEDGAGVHDVIGTRCDPYTNHLLAGGHYHHCCHSNLTHALMKARAISRAEAEPLVHDVLNVFMCTGFTRDTHQYFMKASPVRPGDTLELIANIDLLGGLSCCPGGDCGAGHSSDQANCYPLEVEILAPDAYLVRQWTAPPKSGYQWRQPPV